MTKTSKTSKGARFQRLESLLTEYGHGHDERAGVQSYASSVLPNTHKETFLLSCIFLVMYIERELCPLTYSLSVCAENFLPAIPQIS